MLPVFPAFSGYVPDELIVCCCLESHLIYFFIIFLLIRKFILMCLIPSLLLGRILKNLTVMLFFLNLLIPYSKKLHLCSLRNKYIQIHSYILIINLWYSFTLTDFYGYTSHFYNGDLFMEMEVWYWLFHWLIHWFIDSLIYWFIAQKYGGWIFTQCFQGNDWIY